MTRISVRLDEETKRQLDELINFYQADSISKITVADVIRKAVDTLYQDSTVK